MRFSKPIARRAIVGERAAPSSAKEVRHADRAAVPRVLALFERLRCAGVVEVRVVQECRRAGRWRPADLNFGSLQRHRTLVGQRHACQVGPLRDQVCELIAEQLDVEQQPPRLQVEQVPSLLGGNALGPQVAGPDPALIEAGCRRSIEWRGGVGEGIAPVRPLLLDVRAPRPTREHEAKGLTRSNVEVGGHARGEDRRSLAVAFVVAADIQGQPTRRSGLQIAEYPTDVGRQLATEKRFALAALAAQACTSDEAQLFRDDVGILQFEVGAPLSGVLIRIDACERPGPGSERGDCRDRPCR